MISQHLCLLLLCGSIAGCATPTLVHIPFDDIVHKRQAPDQCGPFALSVMLQHVGVIRSPEDIAHDIFDVDSGGTESVDLLVYIQRLGLIPEVQSGTLPMLKERLRNGYPVLVALKQNQVALKAHFSVVYGFSRDSIVMHDGVRSDKWISEIAFLHQWALAGNMMLVIHKDHV